VKTGRITAVALGLTMLAGCSTHAQPIVPVADQTVVLEVTSVALGAGVPAPTEVMVTWDDNGAVSQSTETLPWTMPANAPTSLSAQNQGEFGTITCRIMQGTTVLQESSASNAYGVCSVAVG
jgi:hypothetical protein